MEELYNLYNRSLLQQYNINLSNIREDEYHLVAAHIANKMPFVEWYKSVIQSEHLLNIDNIDNIESEVEPIPTKEEQAEHNKKMMVFLPKAAKQQLEKKSA